MFLRSVRKDQGIHLGVTIGKRGKCTRIEVASRSLLGRGSVEMVTYRIFVQCDYCEENHPLPFAVSKENLPSGKKSIAEIYGDRKLPDDIYSIISISVQCSKTGKNFVQKDLRKIFMIPV